MAAVFHRQTEPYSSHEAGDSIYDHSGEKVKTSVLGFAIALTLGFSAIELVAGGSETHSPWWGMRVTW